MKIFKYHKYMVKEGNGSSWAKTADGKQAYPYNGRWLVKVGNMQFEVLPEWCIDAELSDMEKYTVKKEVRKTVSLLYEAWDRLSGLNNTIDAVDFKEADKIDELVYDLNKYLKEEL